MTSVAGTSRAMPIAQIYNTQRSKSGVIGANIASETAIQLFDTHGPKVLIKFNLNRLASPY